MPRNVAVTVVLKWLSLYQVSEAMPSPGKFNCFRNFASVLSDLER